MEFNVCYKGSNGTVGVRGRTGVLGATGSTGDTGASRFAVADGHAANRRVVRATPQGCPGRLIHTLKYSQSKVLEECRGSLIQYRQRSLTDLQYCKLI